MAPEIHLWLVIWSKKQWALDFGSVSRKELWRFWYKNDKHIDEEIVSFSYHRKQIETVKRDKVWVVKT